MRVNDVLRTVDKM